MQLLAGTSGFSYKEWVGPFYPDKLAAKAMLAHYATRLPIVEINNTFYRMPSAEAIAAWRAEVTDSFRFAIKVPRRISHLKRLRGCGEDMAVLDRKEAMFRASLAVSVEPVRGIHALLDWAEMNGAGCAVVTNAPRDNAVAMLAAASLAHRLPTVVIGDECPRPKPDPAPYQAAMAALGATPSRSVAFEDSRSGLRAARASGARVFGMTTGLTPDELIQAGAHATIADFTDPALWTCLDQLGTRVA